jgi:hypothetical protein
MCMKWQPIETAPKDESHVLIYERQEITIGWWIEACQAWATVEAGASTINSPTHWMPLPVAPGKNRVLADEEEWRFELGYLDPSQPDKPTHVLAGIWEQPPGYLYWTMHEISERLVGCRG